jgi:hypothetical protein
VKGAVVLFIVVVIGDKKCNPVSPCLLAFRLIIHPSFALHHIGDFYPNSGVVEEEEQEEGVHAMFGMTGWIERLFR